ncbi:LLM class flavin-dependent oxidoreductase [Microlunatus soli]|uniref:Flavin-dependent oxidoreductase, luciferase family (Includes alkanesulfonate monooxygenase SsuD and methylene tetrahydromethanopterin reductase) n=1 Tax=Microlunatus soli TaxID=630515 RepID=A0A1H1PJQ7_9ACTN|nr:LLM class flavin-dependent oxidoreductase [Microlunatus soli]SDS11522.1 Flavin-dependent oxidoreductase, luciferase family (includes alkanesulfonate monooxygenase SsuD and methylene tetrahydromethanopterin reductase) [Microlunatus soli]
MALSTSLHLGVALEGLGTHPRAWRLRPQLARRAFGARYYLDLIRVAERAGIDFAYFTDGYALQSEDDRNFRGRLDAALLASRLAPVTGGIGLVPEFTVTHAEPFHISKAVATLDHTSEGRAGWAPITASSADPTAEEQNRHFGRRELLDPQTADAEAGEVADVVQRLFDSWEDDAEIRDLPTGRFIDRDKLHYVDFDGEFFSVKGPSITPRPPQGRPPTVFVVRTAAAASNAGRHADVAVVTAGDLETDRTLADGVRAAALEAGRSEPLPVLVGYQVLLAGTADQVKEQRAVLDHGLAQRPTARGIGFEGTPGALVEELAGIGSAGFAGALINFEVLPGGLELFADAVVPQLEERGLFRAGDRDLTLRGRFGLTRPVNRYVRS